MPEWVELRYGRPPGFEHLSHEEWAEKIRSAIAAEEEKAKEERRPPRRAWGRGASIARNRAVLGDSRPSKRTISSASALHSQLTPRSNRFAEDVNLGAGY